jgi:hypothetical protein
MLYIFPRQNFMSYIRVPPSTYKRGYCELVCHIMQESYTSHVSHSSWLHKKGQVIDLYHPDLYKYTLWSLHNNTIA